MYESRFRKELTSFLKLKTEYRNVDALPIDQTIAMRKGIKCSLCPYLSGIQTELSRFSLQSKNSIFMVTNETLK